MSDDITPLCCLVCGAQMATPEAKFCHMCRAPFGRQQQDQAHHGSSTMLKTFSTMTREMIARLIARDTVLSVSLASEGARLCEEFEKGKPGASREMGAWHARALDCIDAHREHK